MWGRSTAISCAWTVTGSVKIICPDGDGDFKSEKYISNISPDHRQQTKDPIPYVPYVDTALTRVSRRIDFSMTF